MRKGIPLVLLALLLAAAPAPLVKGAGSSETAEVRAGGDAKDGEEDEPYSLSAAYPNPFREQTRFDLRVDKTQQISVDVYNILGQRVLSLYDGSLRANEERTFTFKAGSLPSGLYLYRVEGEAFTAARRVMLVR